ncbi:exportin-5-like isoform X1 [Megalobrama amblycephala]|uniref:exportin-5-like isoform X1 n=1 Tax=Megalobrama amblycephala TaxID=75352 RepID=UPI002013DDC3|nr:exportin-5-like isoform X1 [Megalobrama amblycephala]
MAEPIRALCDDLIKAVNVMMEAESSQTYRLEALKFIEDFKEKSPFCVECGLQLAEKSQTAVVRHFGLQILEHVVKFQWNNMTPQEKLQLKNCTMGLLSHGTHPILQEECHVKDALSRIVVEMIKREWPQHWPDMLKEMEALTAMGDAQTELVMLVLLRLAEDVMTFQTLPTQRQREIQHTLEENMDSIFTFLRGILIMQLHVNEHNKLKCVAGLELKTKAHWRVGVTTLNTLAGYIDWVALSHITNENCRLLEIFCLLLSEPELQLEAAECLLIAISRKGELEERKPFLILFDEVIMNYILSAAQSADGAPLCKQSSGAVVERRYTFLKRLCQVLCALGSQICSLVCFRVPVNLNKYMEALLAFTTHPSQFLRSSTQITWGNLFRHEIISWDPVIGQMAIKYLRVAKINLVKTGFPSKNDCPVCEFSRVDFDSDEDFNCFFKSFRAQQGSAVRLACKIVPFEAFQIAREWVQYQINTPIDTGNTTSKTEKGLCSALLPSAVQWDAMTFFTESVFGQLFKILEKEKLPMDEGMELLQMVVNYETRDPLILSCVLTIISTLFPFVKHQPHFLPQVLYKIFTATTFELDDEHKEPQTHPLKNIRRHACSSIIRMCRDYSDFILPCFDMMYAHVKSLFSNEKLLTPMEKSSLMEALILISNQFKDYNKQKAFLEELMAPVTRQWLSEEMRSVLWEPATFLAYIGADQEISDPDQMGINRSRQLVMSCPHEYYDSLLCPLLGPLFTYLQQRLSFRWQIINQRTSLCAQEDNEAYEENHVFQEMVEEQLLQVVTREVIDLLSVTCITRKCPKLSANKEDADGDKRMVLKDSSKGIHELSELGKCLLHSEDIYLNLLTICFNSLSWRDTVNCERTAGVLCWTLLKKVLGGNLLPEAVTWIYTSVLKGLQMHGQHEGCSAALTQLAFLIYESLRPRYAELRFIMNQIPDIQVDALEQFDQKAIRSAVTKAGEKKKKEQFRRLIAGTVGKPLGQQFKKEVHIQKLPSLFKKPTKDVLENTDAAGLIALFSPDRDNC